MTVRNKQLLAELKEECTECEICGMPCEFVNYKCRNPDYGSMAEVTSVCKQCHKKWSICNCFTKFGEGKQV